MIRKFRIRIRLIPIMWFFTVFSFPAFASPAVLLDDDFNELRPGMFSAGVIGAHAEYHYVHETAPKGNWVVSCFTSGTPEQRAWWVTAEEVPALVMPELFGNVPAMTAVALAKPIGGDIAPSGHGPQYVAKLIPVSTLGDTIWSSLTLGRGIVH